MKNYFKNISPYIIVIAILVVIIILMKECKRCPTCPEPTTTVIHTRDTVWDTIRLTSVVYKPLPKETIWVEVPADIDTNEILKRYYAKLYYEDILKDDTSAYIFIKDTITQNSIYTREWEFINRRPTIINTTTTINQYDTCKDCKRFNMGFGGFLGGNSGTFQAGVSMMLQTNKKSAYTVSYDVINKTGNIGIYWTIK